MIIGLDVGTPLGLDVGVLVCDLLGLDVVGASLGEWVPPSTRLNFPDCVIATDPPLPGCGPRTRC